MNERLQAEWTKQRVCANCARPYALANHNTPDAQQAARALAAGETPDPRPPELDRCPNCARPRVVETPPAAPGKPQMTDAEAIAAAMAVERQMAGTSMRPFYVNVRRMGLLFAVLCLIILMMLLYLVGNAANGRGGLLLWTALFLLLFGGGLGASFWGHRQVQRLNAESDDSPFGPR